MKVHNSLIGPGIFDPGFRRSIFLKKYKDLLGELSVTLHTIYYLISTNIGGLIVIALG